MIRAISPSYNKVPVGIPVSSITAREFVSFLIFWTFSLSVIWFPVHKIRHLFTIKAYVVPLVGLTLFVWAVYRANGMGPIIHQPATARGSALAWGFVAAIMSALVNFATGIVNN